MNVLGIDPGETSGWCLFDVARGFALNRGQFARHDLPDNVRKLAEQANVVVMERPVAHGPTRPQVVECAWIAGRLIERLGPKVIEMTRLQVKQALTLATHGEVMVKNDATAWAALKLLHGDGCDKRGGAFYGVRAHERAALAVAVAWARKNGHGAEIAVRELAP